MKKHPPSVFGQEIWQEIYFIFRSQPIHCFSLGTSGDGVIPVSVETTKRGVEIAGSIWFLPTANYDLALCLARPSFSSIESVTVAKLKKAIITESCLESGTLRIVIGDGIGKTGEE